MIRFPCACGRQLQARDDDVGRKAKCPQCARIMVVPAADDTPQPQKTAPDGRFRAAADEDDHDERPPRQETVATTSGKAIAALVLGIVSLCLPLVPAIPAILLGALALRDINRRRGEVGGRGLAIAGIVTACASFLLLVPAVMALGLMLPAVNKVRDAAARNHDANNLKQLGRAMHNFSDTYGRLPQATAYLSREGKPGLSWRVALLPFVEEDALYKQFKLDEAWDSPHNHQLLGQMPRVYRLAFQANDGSGMTCYQVFTGPGTLFEAPPAAPPGAAVPLLPDAVSKPVLGLRLPADIPDGTANTVLIATARSPVAWTKPDDLRFAPGDLLPPLGGQLKGGFNVTFADGSVRFLPQNVADPILRALITRNGGEVVNLP